MRRFTATYKNLAAYLLPILLVTTVAGVCVSTSLLREKAAAFALIENGLDEAGKIKVSTAYFWQVEKEKEWGMTPNPYLFRQARREKQFAQWAAEKGDLVRAIEAFGDARKEFQGIQSEVDHKASAFLLPDCEANASEKQPKGRL